jgi:hypothetical protein
MVAEISNGGRLYCAIVPQHERGSKMALSWSIS